MNWLGVGKLLAPMVSQWLAKREIRKGAKLEIARLRAEAEIERARSAAQAETDYDLEVLRQRSHSWVDELLVLSVVMIVGAAFVPDYQQVALEGFNNLAAMPVWFQTIVGRNLCIHSRNPILDTRKRVDDNNNKVNIEDTMS